MFDIKEISTAAMVLFAVIDIIGSVPIIIQLRQQVGHIQSGKASIVSLLIMVAFLYLGEEILAIIGIDINSFAIAGSFILFFLSLELILGIKLYRDEMPTSTSIVPLAFPLIAGAGTMTSLISLRAEYEVQNIIVAMMHTNKKGESKLLRQCTLPLTGTKCVTKVVTELAVLEISPIGFVLKERAPGVSVEQIKNATEGRLNIEGDIPEMKL